jgi:hypothetical protein
VIRTLLSLLAALADALYASAVANPELLAIGGSVAAVFFALGLVLQVVVAAAQNSLS